jgi:hypothetical protein
MITDDQVEHVGRGLYIYWDDVKAVCREKYSAKVRRVLESMPPAAQPTESAKLVSDDTVRVPEEIISRFLSWELPQSVCSDLCVTMQNYQGIRYGTSLLTHAEAKAMLEHVLVDHFVELDDDDTLREMMADILRRTATVLKGEPGSLQGHSWHDLPEIAAALLAAPPAAQPTESATHVENLRELSRMSTSKWAIRLRNAANWIEQHATQADAPPARKLEGFQCAKCGREPEEHWATNGDCPKDAPPAAVTVNMAEAAIQSLAAQAREAGEDLKMGYRVTQARMVKALEAALKI